MSARLQLAPFLKQGIQPLLQPVFIRKGGKTVGADMAAVVRVKDPAQNPCQAAQHLIAFREAVFVVEVLHPAEVDIQESRAASLIQQALSPQLCKFKEARHIRKPGQIIIACGISGVSLEKRFFRPLCLVGAAVLLPVSFVREPEVVNALTVLGGYMLTGDADQSVSGTVLFSPAVVHIQPAVLGSEVHGSVHEFCGIVRMGVLEHIPIGVGIGLRAVLKTEQLAEAVRNSENHNPLIQKLADGKRLTHLLNKKSLFF